MFARDHEKLGEIPVAEIVPEGSRARAAAARRADRGLPRGATTYKVPREFRIVAALARTETGKVKR